MSARLAPAWTFADIPHQGGRTAVVTGANGGIGLWISHHLAARGAHVVLACRSVPKAEAAVAELRAAVPAGSFEILPVDLADLSSVRRAAMTFRSRHDSLDLLINNAGIAMVPFGRTADGFESQFGANFLGHFALTALLADTFAGTPHSRVVHVGSLQHRFGKVAFEDTGFDERRFYPWRGYGQSKVAVLLFMQELERRLRAAGAETISVGSHPGMAGTDIINEMPVVGSPRLRPAAQWVSDHLVPSAEDASRPILYAATGNGVRGGSYSGPGGRFEVRGVPGPARLGRRARRTEDGPRLWELAERLTETRFTL